MTETQEKTEGLGDLPRKEWPKAPSGIDQAPIDILKPKSKAHDLVLKYLLKRLESSEQKMSEFYPRWQVSERKATAYINLPDWEKELEDMNNSGEAPKITRIQVPYMFATLMTITTFLMHAFTGRKPIFQIGSWKDETVESATMMEQKLQYDADHTKLTASFWRFLFDSQIYGLGILRCLWRKDVELRTVRKQQPMMTLEGGQVTKSVPVREEHTVYEGNMIHAQDPYMFFPDPRVPMHEVNKSGEFVFWRVYEGRHMVKREEQKKNFKYVDDANRSLPANKFDVRSSRSTRFGGDPHAAGAMGDWSGTLRDCVQIDQGTCEIIPKELGLGDSERVQKWLFTILNKSQIVQAEAFDCDHGLHPVAVTEPYQMGYSFGAPGMSDYLGPIQDGISWFFNSHIDNVRKVLNDQFVVDPSMIEMQDMKSGEPGKLIRLKRAAFGQDVRKAVNQLEVVDVTRQHAEDGELLSRIGQFISAVSDNIMGMQDVGGRKTATEVRQSGEAAASRLASQAMVISSQGVADLTKMMSLNNQQYLSEDFYIQLLGQEGVKKPMRVTPDQLVGDFYYPVNDGTLPLDRVAMLDVWREIFVALLKDPQLRMEYNLGEIFEHIAELGGARNIDKFKLGPAEQQQALAAATAAGAGQAPPGAQSNGPGGDGRAAPAPETVGFRSPADRMAGSLG